MKHVFDDGGRMVAGFKGQAAGDCVCRSIAIATDTPYLVVYHALNDLGEQERVSKRRKTKSHARTGVHKSTFNRYLVSRGWVWVPTMFIGSGCKVHLRSDELPGGRIIVQLTKHITVVIDGVLHDTYDCSRDGSRCVYGYFTRLTGNRKCHTIYSRHSYWRAMHAGPPSTLHKDSGQENPFII